VSDERKGWRKVKVREVVYLGRSRSEILGELSEKSSSKEKKARLFENRKTGLEPREGVFKEEKTGRDKLVAKKRN